MSTHANDNDYELILDERVQSIWNTFTDPVGLPVSPEGAVILLSLVLAQTPRRISAMDMQDVDFVRRVWHSPGCGGQTYPVPLTRLAVGLIGNALPFSRRSEGTFLFPGRRNPAGPLMKGRLSAYYRRKSEHPERYFRRKSDMPVLAAWIMGNAGVEPVATRAVLRTLGQGDFSGTAPPRNWVLRQSRVALERLERCLMDIVGLDHGHPVFRPTPDLMVRLNSSPEPVDEPVDLSSPRNEAKHCPPKV